ncbi:phosphatase [Streptococcus massiliensis]|uniref:Phosphatase n=1 Tax=Streptococcus massiliensis TaxID=313439 RepID=A0A380KYJ8_9STRE|nr:phosphatase [Streptococcus massiliensis]
MNEIAEQKYFQLDYRPLFREKIVDILDYAKEQGIKLAVASSSREEHILEVLRACGIRDYFDVIVSGENFSESKPNPAIYQAALRSLNVAANQAVAIEDSSYGILAAKSANLTVIAYEETRMLVDQSLADYKGKDMGEILALIKNLNRT